MKTNQPILDTHYAFLNVFFASVMERGDIGGGWRSNGGTHFLLDYCAASSLSV